MIRQVPIVHDALVGLVTQANRRSL